MELPQRFPYNIHNIIHGDLKPANIFEDEYLFPKISDIGMSKFSTESTTGLKGTSIYIAPESWDDCGYSKTGDVYSYAMISYEMLTLEEPFKGFYTSKNM